MGYFILFFHFPQCQHMGDGGRVGDGVGGWFFVFFSAVFIYLFIYLQSSSLFVT